MKYCDLSFPSPEENLACDEALLEACETTGQEEVLRLWEPAQFFVVVGYANKVATEVNLPVCQQHGIPVLRRCSGGGTVLQGPGCLNYSVILRIDPAGPSQSISTTNDYVMQRHQEMLSALLGKPVTRLGHTDLTLRGVKVSGNAQRRRKHFLIFHGSFLLNLDIGLVEQTLPMPSYQPDYRSDRRHCDFLVNLQVPATALKAALRQAWGATEPLAEIPLEHIGRLAREKYALAEWNFKF